MELVPDFYQIAKFDSTDNKIEAQLNLNKDHAIYKGHFPGQPIVPGVMQLQMIKELVEKYLNLELLFSDVTFAKYLHLIDPNTSENLQFEIKFKNTVLPDIKIDAIISDSSILYTKVKGILNKK